MINISRLEELQRRITAMEWDMEQGQFNKRKSSYYQQLLAERQSLLQAPLDHGWEEDENDEGDEDDNWQDNFGRSQTIGINQGLLRNAPAGTVKQWTK